VAPGRGRCGRDRGLRSYPVAAASTSGGLEAACVTRLKTSAVPRDNSNAGSEVDARSRSARSPAPWPVRRGALGLAYAALRHTGQPPRRVRDRIFHRRGAGPPLSEHPGVSRTRRFLAHQD
jgi:hypothetical protein